MTIVSNINDCQSGADDFFEPHLTIDAGDENEPKAAQQRAGPLPLSFPREGVKVSGLLDEFV